MPGKHQPTDQRLVILKEWPVMYANNATLSNHGPDFIHAAVRPLAVSQIVGLDSCQGNISQQISRWSSIF